MGQEPKKNQPPDERLLPAPDSRVREHCATWAVCGLLLLAVTLVYGQTVGHKFINYDDDDYVYENPHVTGGLTSEAVVWAFTHTHSSNWHPLTWLSHLLDCQFFGLWPGGHHLTNVLLHANTAVLLFLVLRQMTGRLWPSAFVAAVFAVHPLHVESVAWVAERKDVLSGLFFMLTLAAYVGYARRPFSLARYLLVALLFAMGLMAKPMLVTLPFVLLLLDYWPLGRWKVPLPFRERAGVRGSGKGAAWSNAEASNSSPHPNPLPAGEGTKFHTPRLTPHAPLPTSHTSLAPPPHPRAPRSGRLPEGEGTGVSSRLLAEKLPLLALAAASCVATLLAQAEAIPSIDEVPVPWRIGNALVSCVAYLGQLFYPLGLAVLYPHPTNHLPVWEVVVALLVLAGISLGALASWRRPYLLVGWLWYLGMLVPVIGLVQVGSQAMADRYTYLPQIGLCIALAWGVADVSRSWPYRRWVCGIASALVVASLMGCAWRQASYWHDSESLWSNTLECTSENHIAHNNLGVALADLGRVGEAIAQYQKALEIKPSYAEAHNNLGVALAGLGQVDEALAHFQKAVEINPNLAGAHYNLGVTLAGLGHLGEAIAHYQKAVEINPNHADAHYNLGEILAGLGQLDKAVVQYEKALEIKADYAEAHYSLGIALVGLRRVGKASAHFQQALEIRPDYAEAHNNLASALEGLGRGDEAIAHYQKALEIKPNYADAHYNLGNALGRLGRGDEAIAHYQKALEIKPDYADAHYNLANALAGRGRVGEAIAHYQKVLKIRPEYAEAHNNLSNALGGLGRVDEAIAHYRKALAIQPDHAEAHNNLANALAGRGQVDEAIAHYQEALRIKPDFAAAHYNLGVALVGRGQVAEAIQRYQECLRLRPDQPQALNGVAWLRATHPDPKIRDGAQAVLLARHAVEVAPDDPEFLNTLAAAYAEAGRFPDAVQTAHKALELAAQQQKSALAKSLRTGIASYEAGKPFRAPPPSPAIHRLGDK